MLNWCGYFFGQFLQVNWATFYSNIWSHWQGSSSRKKQVTLLDKLYSHESQSATLGVL